MDASPIPSSPSPIGSLFFTLILLVCSAYCSAAEMAFTSVNRIRMESLAEDGSHRAKRVLRVLECYDQALVTILISNNLVNIGCASLVTILFTNFWGQGAVASATVVTTAVVLLLGEILPKSYAKNHAETFSLRIASSLLVLMGLFSPITKLLSIWTSFLQKKSKEKQVTVTESELTELIETAVREGALDEETTELVQSALEFTRRSVREVMTPWEQVLYIRTDTPPPKIIELIQKTTHSRLPVLDSSDLAVGVLQIRRFLKAYMQRQGHVSPRRVMETPYFASADEPIDELLPHMSAQKSHLAFVRNAEGNLVGIVTVEDIIEELLGEIYDEEDSEQAEQVEGIV